MKSKTESNLFVRCPDCKKKMVFVAVGPNEYWCEACGYKRTYPRAQSRAGRKVKRKFPRNKILKVRVGEPYKVLIADIRKDFASTIISDADIVEWALEQYGAGMGIYLSVPYIKGKTKPY